MTAAPQVIPLSIYEAIAPDRAIELQAIALQIRDRAEQIHRSQIKVAELVARAKELLPNRQNWLRWLKEEFPEMSQRQAYRLVRLHDSGVNTLPGAADQPLTVLEIAAAAEPEARAEIEQRLMDGDRLTIAEAKAIAAQPDPDSDADFRQQQRLEREQASRIPGHGGGGGRPVGSGGPTATAREQAIATALDRDPDADLHALVTRQHEEPMVGSRVMYNLVKGERKRPGRVTGQLDDGCWLVTDEEDGEVCELGPEDWRRVEEIPSVEAHEAAIALPEGRDNIVRLATSAKTDEHYTPPKILDAVYRCFNDWVELDPCSNAHGDAANVQAMRHFTAQDDAAKQVWDCTTLYMNPPFGKVAEFMARLALEYERGGVDEAIALTKCDPRTGWFSTAMREATAFCLVKGYTRFVGSTNAAPFGVVLWYFGPEPDRFYAAMEPIGWPCQLMVPGVHFGE